MQAVTLSELNSPDTYVLCWMCNSSSLQELLVNGVTNVLSKLSVNRPGMDRTLETFLS